VLFQAPLPRADPGLVPRGLGLGRGCPLPNGEGLGRGLSPSPENFLNLNPEMAHFCAF